MLTFSHSKRLTILSVAILGILWACVSMMPDRWREHLPAFLADTHLSYGLDLQGGVHLLIDVDLESYEREQLAFLTDRVRTQLRAEKIRYRHLRSDTDQVRFELTEEDDIDRARAVLRKISRDLQLSNEKLLISLRFQEEYRLQLQRNVLDQSIEIVRRRVDETGTREPSITRQGERRIVLQVPGVSDPDQLKRLLGKTAKLSFHMAAGEDADSSSTISIWGENERNDAPIRYNLQKQPVVTGDMLIDAATSLEGGTPAVLFRFNNEGARLFGKATRENVGRLLAIVLDQKVIFAPRISEPIPGGSGIINGNFTVEGANELALLLRAGALPAPLNVIEERVVGPSLGADSIVAGKMAALIGTALVVGFMIITYGVFGVFATIALTINMLLVIALLSLFHATLTMPGIAGIVLTMGMAVDANVLIFERIREEIKQGMTIFAAVERGFRQAYSAIVDSNVTTILVALLLYNFGSGPVKGFAVTLILGILSSMFTAITVTRLIVSDWVRWRRPRDLGF
jgi:preprotein translocase subunit SecD